MINFLTQLKNSYFLLTSFHPKFYLIKSVAQANKAFRKSVACIQTSYRPKLVKIITKIFVLNKVLPSLSYLLNRSIR